MFAGLFGTQRESGLAVSNQSDRLRYALGGSVLFLWNDKGHIAGVRLKRRALSGYVTQTTASGDVESVFAHQAVP